MKKETSKLWTILPYNIGKIESRYLITTFFGSWVDLSLEEFKKLHSLKIEENSNLFKKLVKEKIILTEENIKSLINQIRLLHQNWFEDTGLHIAVVTDACNYNCVYCQAYNPNQSFSMMDYQVAVKVLEFMFSVSNPNIKLEIQGGEPLLNWKIVKFLIENARKINKIRKKNLIIALVSNLALLDRKKAEFLLKHNVEISTSLDGPKFIQDKNRPTKLGKSSYDLTTSGIKLWIKQFKQAGKKPLIGALPTITKLSLPYYKQIVDEYVKWKFPTIHLRPLTPLGLAKKKWNEIGYKPEQFIKFWEKAMDYILELNQKGINLKETMAEIMLKKILKKKDPKYVDLESPCGAGRSQIAYDPTGDIYTCDEARMTRLDVFKLGNVLKDKYQDIGKNPNFYYTAQSSMIDFYDYASPFYPWSGTCPVVNLATQKNPVVKIYQTFRKKTLDAQFRYIFKKLIFDKKAKQVFEKWVS